MRLAVRYDTAYAYSRPIRHVIQLLRLTPLSFGGQNVLDWRIEVDRDARLQAGKDGFGNPVHMLYVDGPIEGLTVSVQGRILTEDKAGVVGGVPGDLPPPVFLRQTRLTEPGKPLGDLAHALLAQGGSDLDKLHRLTALIHTRMTFDVSTTGVDTSATEAYDQGHGVCQDFAHIFLGVARAIGIPARYISGHLYRSDGAPVQEAGHAWVEAYVGLGTAQLGWVAFDPSNGICADDAYIRVAAGLDYRDAAPVSGARRGGGSEALTVRVEVSNTGAGQRSQSQGQVQDQGEQRQSQTLPSQARSRARVQTQTQTR